MKELNLTEKLIIISFVVITIILLWLISPMGRIFLPVDKSHLEQMLDFKLPEKLELKQYSTEEFGELFHLISNTNPSQITTIIVEKEKYLEEVSDQKFSSTKAKVINEFFKESGLTDTKISDCKEENVITCDFKAIKDELNDITYKEGKVVFLSKRGRPVTILSVAPVKSYDNNILKNLVEKILND